MLHRLTVSNGIHEILFYIPAFAFGFYQIPSTTVARERELLLVYAVLHTAFSTDECN